MFRTLLARQHPAPWIFDDELIYSKLAESFGDSGRFIVRGAHGTLGYGPGYPLLIAPAYAVFGNVPHAYAAAKGINALLMSLAAIPVYLMARRLVARPLALLAAGFALAIPSLEYTGTIMTENAFYPAFLFCVLAFVRAIERPTALRQVVAFAAVVPAYAIRAHAVVLVPAFLTAIVLLAFIEARAAGELAHWRAVLRRLDVFRVTWATAAAGATLVIAIQLARGRSFGNLFGAYKEVTAWDYSPITVGRWFLYHLAELDLYLGFVPLAAFVVVIGLAVRRDAQRSVVVFSTIAVSLLFWFTLTVSAFSAHLETLDGVGRIEERNLFFVAPLLLIALVVWFDRGLPRGRLLAPAAAVAAAALPAVLPLTRFVNLSALSDTLAFIPLARLVIAGHLDPSDLRPVVGVAAVVGALFFLLLPRTMGVLAPLAVLVYLVAWQVPLERQMRDTSQGVLASAITLRREWVDEHVGNRDVVALWSGNVNPLAVTENEFFNRSIRRVYALVGSPPLGGSVSERPAAVNESTGIVFDGRRPLRTAYALSDQSIQLSGKPVVVDPTTGIVLYRTGGVVAVQGRIEGRYADGWSEPQLTYTRYDCANGRLLVSLINYPGLVRRPQQVVASVAGRPVAKASIGPASGRRTLSIPVRAFGGTCRVVFDVSPTGVPARAVGGGDTRELGVFFTSLRYVPGR